MLPVGPGWTAIGYQTLTFNSAHFPIVRMNEHRQMVFLRIVGRKTVIFACDLIRIETTPIRPQDEDMLRNGIDELSQLSFALPELFFRTLLLDGHSRQMSDLPDEVLMLQGRAVQVPASRSRRCLILFHRMTILEWTNKPAVHVPWRAYAIRTCPIARPTRHRRQSLAL